MIKGTNLSRTVNHSIGEAYAQAAAKTSTLNKGDEVKQTQGEIDTLQNQVGHLGILAAAPGPHRLL